MPNSPNKKNYNANYAKTNLKRIPLDVQKEKYDQIKAAASPFSILCKNAHNLYAKSY